MSPSELPFDIIRLIALRLDNVSHVHSLTTVYRRTYHALSADEFWKLRCEQDFSMSGSSVITFCKQHQLRCRSYYQKYSRTYRIDKLVRSWISKEDLGRFYPAFVRFFHEKWLYHTTPLTKQQRKHYKYQRRKGHSRPNDIWIYGQADSGKTLFSLFMSRVVDGFTTVPSNPQCHLCEETSNRLYIDYSPPNGNFAGEIFEFRSNFAKEDSTYRHRNPLRDISRRELQEYLSILERYGGDFYA